MSQADGNGRSRLLSRFSIFLNAVKSSSMTIRSPKQDKSGPSETLPITPQRHGRQDFRSISSLKPALRIHRRVRSLEFGNTAAQKRGAS